ncbi:MAG: DUF2079 domain-containing protein [Planctomycetaceae bacterium]|nr:DUF2079 domain-containing protein [Planctomycetaceae bacterium]
MAPAIFMIVGGTALHALAVQSILQDSSFAKSFMSLATWQGLMRFLGCRIIQGNGFAPSAVIGYLPIFLLGLLISFTTWGLGAAWISRRRSIRYQLVLARWGFLGWAWWLFGGSWELVRLLLLESGWQSAAAIVSATPEFWQAAFLAGWMTTGVQLGTRIRESGHDLLPSAGKIPRRVWIAIALFTLIFGWMNTQLYRGLLLPHGDSAMYEEHLWNLLHGKGFRSYLDQGLFLGEHIQIIHLALIPIYIIFPSHLTLEWAESFALALGAIPVYRMTFRQSRSRRVAIALAVSYLFYFPTQRLDIEIDFKTFRPEAFGIPLLLLALDMLDARRWTPFLAASILTMLVKEDYALVFAPLGLWIIWQHWKPKVGVKADRLSGELIANPRATRHWRYLGVGYLIGATLYLALALKVLIPYFRSGAPIHYVRYFPKFGNSIGEIIVNIILKPGLFLSEVFAPSNWVFALALLLPMGILAILSPGRLLVAAPLFGALSLNEIARDPQHHFHAPLVALLYWSAAEGIIRVRWFSRITRLPLADSSLCLARWGLLCSIITGFFFSLSPAGFTFWDSGASAYWQAKYVPGERARQFPKVLEKIPPTSRVASTDFIHPRFTHHLRSYDYSDYRPQVPADTDFIVIDCKGPYSQISRPDQVKEYRDHPDEWELLPDETDGCFIILKRRRAP